MATLYAEPSALEGWRARGGHPPMVAYASGGELDPGHAVVRLVGQWVAQGQAEAHKQRGGDGVLRHLVRLKPAPLRQAQGERSLGPAAAEQARAKLQFLDWRVLRVLRAHAGEALPVNHEIARLAGLRDDQAAHYRLRKLQALGLIQLTFAHNEEGREVRFARVLEQGEG